MSSNPMLKERLRVGASSSGETEPVTSLGREQIQHLPGVGEDAARKLAALPGITSSDRTARFSIRGGDPGEALVVLDGLAFHLQDFAAFSSIVDGRAIGRVDVMTGIFPAEYGDRAAGVVDLSTNDPADAGRTVVGFSTVNAGLLSGGSLGDGRSWLVSARSWRPDAVVDSVTLGGDGINPSYNDLLGKMEFRLPGGSLLSAHLLASQDSLDYRTDFGDGRVGAVDEHRYAWVGLKTPWTTRLYSQTLFSSSRSDRNRHGAVRGTDDVTRLDDARSYGSMQVKQDWVFQAGERSLFKWGLDFRRLEAQYQYRSHVQRPDGTVSDRDLILDPAGTDYGAYMAGRLRIAAPLTLEVGVRRDRQSMTGETETSPRVNLAFALGERTTLRSGWGRFSQPQAIHELSIEDGDVDFHPAQRAEHREIDLEHLFIGGLRMSVSVYLKDMTDVRPRFENLFDPFQLFPEFRQDRVRIAPDRARARGIEITLGRERRRSLGWRAAYTLASAEDEIDGTWVPRSWDQRHTFHFAADYSPGDKWEFSVAGMYHTGWPTTGVRAEQSQTPDGSPGIQPILGPRNALRYPPYHRLDLKVTRKFRLRDGTLGLYLDVTNVYGRRNVCCAADFTYLPQPDGSVRVERTDGYWLRQLPVAGLAWDF